MLNPWGKSSFWIGGGEIYWEHGEDTDMEAVQNNFVSISPVHLDLTNYNALKFMRETWKISDMLEDLDEKIRCNSHRCQGLPGIFAARGTDQGR